MNILYLNSRLPHALGNALDARQFGLLSNSACHHRITAVILSQEKIQPPLTQLQKFCDSYYQIQHKRNFFPFTLHSFPRYRRHKINIDYKTLRRTVRRILQEKPVDLIHCGHASLMKALPREKEVPVLLQLDSLSPELLIMQLAQPKAGSSVYTFDMLHGARNQIRNACEKADHIIVPAQSIGDQVIAFRTKATVSIVPPGVDTSYYVNNGSVNADKTIVLPGVLNQQEDRDAILHFIRQMWGQLHRRDPELRLFIVGNESSDEILWLNRLKNIYVATDVKDPRQIVREATAVIFPHQRCEVVHSHVLEAMAQSKAVVATPNAAAGLKVVDGQNIILAASVEAFAEKIIVITNDAFQRRMISVQARALVEAFHSWEVVSQSLLDAYREVASLGKYIKGKSPLLEFL
ncbi:MAG: glycosyltransferase [Calditrichaeota bacterium]|nr:MAG: glycosyltransferase [Calditrichota bacterium]